MHIFESADGLPATGEVTAKAAIPVTARAVFSKYKILPGAGVNFGPIIYGTDKNRSLEITNTGEFAHDYAILGARTQPRVAPTPGPDVAGDAAFAEPPSC